MRYYFKLETLLISVGGCRFNWAAYTVEEHFSYINRVIRDPLYWLFQFEHCSVHLACEMAPWFTNIMGIIVQTPNLLTWPAKFGAYTSGGDLELHTAVWAWWTNCDSGVFTLISNPQFILEVFTMGAVSKAWCSAVWMKVKDQKICWTHSDQGQISEWWMVLFCWKHKTLFS
jgi:hypothetical protein